MGGRSTGIYETSDGGTTWTNTGVGASLNRIFVISNNLAYASGKNIYKMTAGSLGVQEASAENTDLKLKVEVVPNPVKDKLAMNVHFMHSDHIIVGLYDISGKFIGNIIKDDIRDKGVKKYAVDFAYPAGQYLLDIHSNLGRQSVKIIKE